MPRSNADQFSRELDAFMRVVESRYTHVFRRVAFVCYENLKVGGRWSPGSPVDTGFFRNAWIVSCDPSAAVVDTPWTMSNNTEYGPALEYGHSQQAPHGFLGLLAQNFDAIMAETLADTARGFSVHWESSAS